MLKALSDRYISHYETTQGRVLLYFDEDVFEFRFAKVPDELVAETPPMSLGGGMGMSAVHSSSSLSSSSSSQSEPSSKSETESSPSSDSEEERAHRLEELQDQTQDQSRASLCCLKLKMNHSIFTAVLLGAVYVLAKVEGHIDIQVIACQTNDTAPEHEDLLDGDEMFYVDFKNKEIILTLPDFADKFNTPGWYEQAQVEHATCLNNLEVAVKSENDPPEAIDPPESTVYAREEVELGKKNILICFVNNFHPAPVKVTWTKNNAEVKDGVTLSRYYPNRDLTFQQFSTLSITPEEGDAYSCTVEHKGLQDPLTKIWGEDPV
ncbi:hypothetical protein COCON_G00006980 [Conger conger]|uniref:Ig-like domain-containing protein n=1 Tax=Conger conger TaxID=82655 RepID=A0A9Q1E2C6_CONCO|nr:hypothetical protein COCON_G00006980 [Conger conger]